MTTQPSILLAGVSIPVRLPESYSCTLDVAESIAGDAPMGRAGAALLAFCIDWAALPAAVARDPRFAPFPFTYRSCGWNVPEFGGRVVDELHRRGVPVQDIGAAGLACWRLCNGTPPDLIHSGPSAPMPGLGAIAEEATEAANFTAPPGAPST
jgi:hypothetical protein